MNTVFRKICIVSLLIILSNGSHATSLFTDDTRASLMDTDKDGVINARDRCPNTPANSAIDNTGCSKESSKLLSVNLKILFDSGKSAVKPKFYSEVMKLADFMKEHEASTVVIEGYTDNAGSDEFNQVLSQKRADAIANVLTDVFKISKYRVKAIGYGEEHPIDSNETEEGRENNRRVVAHVFAEEKIKTQRWTIYSVDKNVSTSFYNKS